MCTHNGRATYLQLHRGVVRGVAAWRPGEQWHLQVAWVNLPCRDGAPECCGMCISLSASLFLGLVNYRATLPVACLW